MLDVLVQAVGRVILVPQVGAPRVPAAGGMPPVANVVKAVFKLLACH